MRQVLRGKLKVILLLHFSVVVLLQCTNILEALCSFIAVICVECYAFSADTVGWASGRASSL